MQRADELKLRAREFERAGNPSAALDLYLRLAAESDADSAAALWTRIGDLQVHLGRPGAEESYSRAIDLFAAAGQPNNAIAVCSKQLESDPHRIAIQLRLGELAIQLGYRRLARTAIGEFARRAAGMDRVDEAVGAIDAYLDHFPDEIELWREWVAEILELGRDADAILLLRRLWEHFAERGEAEAAARVRDEIVQLSPADDPGHVSTRASPGASSKPPSERPVSAEADVGPSAVGGDPVSSGGETEIAPLSGFEPTLVESNPPDAESPEDPVEPLPLLDTSGALRTPHPAAAERDAEDLPPATSPSAERSDESPGEGRAHDLEPLPILDPSSLDDDATGAGLDLSPVEAAAGQEPAEPAAAQEGEPASAPATPPNRPPAGDIATAIAELRRIAPRVIAPADPHSHYELAVAFKEMGLHDDALARFGAALDSGHPPLPILDGLGEILVGRGDHQAAVRILGPAVASAVPTDPELAGGLYWLARSAEASGDSIEARMLLERLVALNPTYRDAAARLRRHRDDF